MSMSLCVYACVGILLIQYMPQGHDPFALMLLISHCIFLHFLYICICIQVHTRMYVLYWGYIQINIIGVYTDIEH